MYAGEALLAYWRLGTREAMEVCYRKGTREAMEMRADMQRKRASFWTMYAGEAPLLHYLARPRLSAPRAHSVSYPLKTRAHRARIWKEDGGALFRELQVQRRGLHSRL